MKEFMKELIIIWLALFVATSCFLLGMSLGIAGGKVEGYKEAYQDSHDGKLEKITQEKYPELWIKHNIPKNKGGEK